MDKLKDNLIVLLFLTILSSLISQHINAQTTQKDHLKSTALNYYNTGLNLIAEKRYQKAEASLLKAISLDPSLIEAWRQLGWLYESHEKPQKAINAWLNLLRQKEDDIEALKHLGWLYQEEKRLKEACWAWEKVTRINPNDKEAWMNLAWNYEKLRKLPEAIEAWKNIIKKNPSSTEAWRHLGWLYESIKDFENAIFAWENFLRLEPKSCEALNTLARLHHSKGELITAIKLYEKSLSVRPNQPEIYISLTYLLYQTKNYQNLIDICKKALSYKIDQPILHEMLFNSYMQLRMYDEAIKEGHRLTNLYPDNFYIKFDLLKAYYWKKDFKGLKKEFKRLFGVNPLEWKGNPKVLNLMAKASILQGNLKEGIKLFEKSLQINMNQKNVVLELADLYLQVSDYKKAIKHLRLYLDENPRNQKVLKKLIFVLFKTDKICDALKQVRLYKKIFGFEWELHLSVVNELLSKNRKPEALKLIEDTLLKNPDLPEGIILLKRVCEHDENLCIDFIKKILKKDKAQFELRKFLARILYSKKMYKEAIKYYQILAQQKPDSISVLREMAQSYIGLGSYSKAIDAYKKILKIEPFNYYILLELAKTYGHAKNYKKMLKVLKEIISVKDQRLLPVLLYHEIRKAPNEPGLDYEIFKKHLLLLKEKGYTTINLKEAVNFFYGKEPFPKKPILITFDDGKTSTYKYAHPLLKELGMKAVMFVITSEVGNPGYVTWKECKEMILSGVWEIQPHGEEGHSYIKINSDGKSGLFFTNKKWIKDRLETDGEFEERIKKEFKRTNQKIKDALGKDLEIYAFAFPLGEFGQERLGNFQNASQINLSLIKKFYKLAFTVTDYAFNHRNSDPYRIARIDIQSNWLPETLNKRLRYYDPFTEAERLYKNITSKINN